MDNYLRSLGAAGSLENLDNTGQLSPDEYFEALEIENFMKTAKRVPGPAARQFAERAVKNPSIKMQVKEQMRKAGVAGGFQSNPAMPTIAASLEAQVNFQVKRLTANIASDLPVVLFGSFDLASQYSANLAGLLPSGVTLTGLDVGKIAGGELFADFTYTQGLNSDTIRVSCQEYAYPSFLEALKGSRFIISNARYSISDTTSTGLQQMSKQMQFKQQSMFGKTSVDKVPLSASKSPFQQQNGIVDILGQYTIDAERAFTLQVQDLANQEITISAFITGADKIGPGI